MKKLFRLFVVLVFLIIIGLVAAYLYIDVLAKGAIERGSTYALGVQTSLESAGLNVLQGELSLSGLHVANPEQFSSPHFLKMKTGDVAVKLPSLGKDVVVVPKIALSEIDINLEKKGQQANYKVILENLKRLESDKPVDKDAQGKRFIINDLHIQNVIVHVDMLGGRELTKLNVPIDEIRLRNVGSGSKRGVLLSELSSVIIKAILTTAAERGGGIIPDDVVSDLKSRLAQLEGLERIADVEKFGDLLKPGADLKDVGKAIGDLLKKE